MAKVITSRKFTHGTAKLVSFNPNSDKSVTLYRVSFIQQVKSYSTVDKGQERRSTYIITEDIRSAAMCYEARYGRDLVTKFIVLTPKLVNNISLVAEKTKQKDLKEDGNRAIRKVTVRLKSNKRELKNTSATLSKSDELRLQWNELASSGLTITECIEYLELDGHSKVHIGRTMPIHLREVMKEDKVKSKQAKKDSKVNTTRQVKSNSVGLDSDKAMVKVDKFNIMVQELPPEKKELKMGTGFVSGRFKMQKFY